MAELLLESHDSRQALLSRNKSDQKSISNKKLDEDFSEVKNALDFNA